MSDHGKGLIGLIFILASLLFAAVPAIRTDLAAEYTFRSGNSTVLTLQPIPAERDGLIRVNDADTSALTKLPGIGEVISSRMILERETNGPYYYAEDLESVHGIGPVLLGKIRDMIDFSTNESGE